MGFQALTDVVPFCNVAGWVALPIHYLTWAVPPGHELEDTLTRYLYYWYHTVGYWYSIGYIQTALPARCITLPPSRYYLAR